MTISTGELDEIILSAVEHDWKKVAMIIGRAKDVCQLRQLTVSDEILADRIAEMAKDGRLESQGDVTLWRRSEIRLPEPAPQHEV